MEKNLVTIVVPAFQAEPYIKDTILSLIGQTFQNLEIIAINDGSTDKTGTILDEFSTKIQVIHQKNQGQSVTLNLGWERAKGDLIGYLGADDLLHPDCLAELVSELRSHPECPVIYPDYDLIDSRSKTLKTVIAPNFSIEDLLLRGICAPGPGALFRKSAFLKTGGWDPRFRQIPDFEFWLRLSSQGNFLHHPKNLASFRVHETSQSFRAPNFDKAEEPVLAISEFWKNFESQLPETLSRQKKSSLASSHLLSMRLHLKAARLLMSCHHWFLAIAIQPRVGLSVRAGRLVISGLISIIYYRLKSFLNSTPA